MFGCNYTYNTEHEALGGIYAPLATENVHTLSLKSTNVMHMLSSLCKQGILCDTVDIFFQTLSTGVLLVGVTFSRTGASCIAWRNQHSRIQQTRKSALAMSVAAVRENYLKAQIMNSYETFQCELQKEDIVRNCIRTLSAINRNISDVQSNLKAIRVNSGYCKDAQKASGTDSRPNVIRPRKAPEGVDTESREASERQGGVKITESKMFPFCQKDDKQPSSENNTKYLPRPTDRQRAVLKSRSYQNMCRVSGYTMKGTSLLKPAQNIQERGKYGNILANNEKDVNRDTDAQGFKNVVMIQKVGTRGKMPRPSDGSWDPSRGNSAKHLQGNQSIQITTKNTSSVLQSGQGTKRMSADVPRVTTYKLILHEKGTQILNQNWTPPNEVPQKMKEPPSATGTTVTGDPPALVPLHNTGHCDEGRTLPPFTESRVKSAPVLSYKPQRQKPDSRRRSSGARYLSAYDNRDVNIYVNVSKSEKKRILQELISNCNVPFDRSLVEKETQRLLREKISAFVASLDQDNKNQAEIFSDRKN